jgi:hypothetical protein
MLKNTKVVGIAAAITLLTGVAFAPSASAINGNTPTLSVDGADINVDAGERIGFEVTGVRTGCAVTTKVGPVTKTVTARHDRDYAASVVGWVNTYIKAPGIAGEYKVASMISNSCATNPGYKRAADMTEDITVGTEVFWDGSWDDSGAGDSVRIDGTVEESDGVTGVDLDGVKVLFLIKGNVVGSAYTDSTGNVSVNIAGKHMNSRGDTRVVIKLQGNKTEYMDSDAKEVVNPS